MKNDANRILEVRVAAAREKLSRTAAKTLSNLENYDWILFTSKHAVSFFAHELRSRGIPLPKKPRIAAVGPTTAKSLRKIKLTAHAVPENFTALNLVKELGVVRGLRILFPRSALAPYDSIKMLRARGAKVTPLTLYTTHAVPLSAGQKSRLIAGKYTMLFFKSPSGVDGFMQQLTHNEQHIVQTIPARCIGPTTAKAARKAGFKKISIKPVI